MVNNTTNAVRKLVSLHDKEIVKERLNDTLTVIKSIKPKPDRDGNVKVECSLSTTCSNALQVIGRFVERYSNSSVIKALANLTVLKQHNDNYVLAWIDNSSLAIEYIGNSNYNYDYERWGCEEFIEDPVWFWTNGRVGDCDDIATAIATLLKAKGYNVTVVCGYMNDLGHVWVEVKIGNKTYIGDTSVLYEYLDVYVFTPKDKCEGYKPIRKLQV